LLLLKGIVLSEHWWKKRRLFVVVAITSSSENNKRCAESPWVEVKFDGSIGHTWVFILNLSLRRKVLQAQLLLYQLEFHILHSG
jgi:hypothetical protein